MFKTIINSFKVLDSKEKLSLYLLFFLILIAIFIETLSVGLIIPFITLLVDFEKLMSFELVNLVLDFLKINSEKQIILLGMSILLIVYVIKNIYLAFFIYINALFAFKIHLNLSEKLFFSYLKQEYNFHLQKNSSELIRNISSESGRVVSAITSSMQLFTETLILISITSLLIYFEPQVAIVTILVLGSAGIISNLITKKPIDRIGQERVIFQAIVLKNLMQGLYSIKDTLLMWKQRSFMDQFHFSQFKLLDATRRFTFINSLPRLWLEILVLGGLVMIIFMMLSNDNPINEILPILSLFAASAIRLMPCIHKILHSIQQLRYSKPAVIIINEELNSKNFRNTYEDYINTDDSKKLKSLISIDTHIKMIDISFKYPESNELILKNINLNIKRGESIGIVGASGSGKSTLINLFLGLLKPSIGEILIDVNNINDRLKEWQTNIGYVPQFVYLTDDSILNNIAFGVKTENINYDKVDHAISQSQLQEFIGSLPNGLNTIIGENGARISGGQRQRIGIARSLYNDPDLLVLDEATSSLDNETEKNFIEVIKGIQKNKTIIIVSHRYSTVKYCNRILKIEDGKINE